MKGKYAGSIPLNARVTVDYESGDVKFGYPNRVSRRAAMRKAFLSLYGIFLLGYVFSILLVVVGWLLIYSVTSLASSPPMISNIASTIIPALLAFLALSAVIFLPPLALTMYVFADEERFKIWFPKINAKFSRILGGETYKIVFRKTKDKRVEIPMFSNMVMDYKAVGDFGRNLQKVEIKEHDFSMRLRKKEKKNEYLWRAIFTFKEDCTRGYLKVSFI